MQSSHLQAIRLHVIATLDKQLTVAIPPRHLERANRQLPTGKATAAEWDEIGSRLALRLVDHQTPQMTKRYRLTEHKGSTLVSLPRHWLRDHAHVGDFLYMLTDDGVSIFFEARKAA